MYWHRALFICSLALSAFGGDYGYLPSLRIATVPYKVDHPAKVMVSYLPLLWIEEGRLYLRGLDAGVHLYRDETLKLSALARWRFVDMPRSDPQYFSNDRIDTGLGITLGDDATALHLSFFQDGDAHHYEELRASYRWCAGAYRLDLAAALQYRPSVFNSYYYGLDRRMPQSVAGVTELTLTRTAAKHVHLYATLKAEHHGLEAPHLSAQPSLSFVGGVQLLETDHTRIRHRSYLQSGVGLATRGSFSEQMTLSAKSDPHHHTLASLFYGYLLSDHLFRLNVPLYLHSGVALHPGSSYQSQSIEGVCALKLYMEIFSGLRLGLANGLSYISSNTYVERWANQKDGYPRSSRFMNHLDISLELPMSTNLSLGYGIFHRSGIFESVQSFEQIKGGSNYHHFFMKIFL